MKLISKLYNKLIMLNFTLAKFSFGTHVLVSLSLLGILILIASIFSISLYLPSLFSLCLLRLLLFHTIEKIDAIVVILPKSNNYRDCAVPYERHFHAGYARGIRHISLWFNEIWHYGSLNHNGICPYANSVNESSLTYGTFCYFDDAQFLCIIFESSHCK